MNPNGNKTSFDRDERTTLSTTPARQGVTGHNVRYVLLGGLSAIIVLFVIVFIAYFA